MQIGVRARDAGQQDSFEFDGLISHVQVHDETLTSVLVNENMWKPGFYPGGLIGFWHAWEAGDSEPDLSLNANTGTDDGTTGDPITSLDGPPVMFGGGLPL